MGLSLLIPPVMLGLVRRCSYRRMDACRMAVDSTADILCRHSRCKDNMLPCNLVPMQAHIQGNRAVTERG